VPIPRSQRLQPWVSISSRGGLCKRCELDTDCPYPADKCIVVNNEKVCGRDCAFNGTCPGSYRCLSGLGADGLNKPQQWPTDGHLRLYLHHQGAEYSCEVENGFGRCAGERACEGTTGYGACTARTPVKETCNGVNDDCNGTIDDSLPTVTCGVGACLRTASSCAAGQMGTCTPGDAGIEACNGLDDDCDGTGGQRGCHPHRRQQLRRLRPGLQPAQRNPPVRRQRL
jgi:hypothetical protein